jgi:hypothetical protein
MISDKTTHKHKVDAAILRLDKAQALTILGWELLISDIIPAAFIWSGFRVGSDLWLWWFLGEAFLAVGMVLVAGRIGAKAFREAGRAMEAEAITSPAVQPATRRAA